MSVAKVTEIIASSPKSFEDAIAKGVARADKTLKIWNLETLDRVRTYRGHRDYITAVALAAGGKDRQDSVWNGLQALNPATEIVAIQDAARPCTSAALVARAASAP